MTGRAIKGLCLWFVLFYALICAYPRDASAHAARTAYLIVTETSSGTVDLEWRSPVDATTVFPRVDPPCREDPAAPRRTALRSQRRVAMTLQCDASNGGRPLDGRTIELAANDPRVAAVVIQIERLPQGGDDQSTRLRAVLTAGSPRLVVPGKPQTTLETAARFVALGFDHLLGGVDHLLFVLGLLWLSRRTRTLVMSITSFTIAHSLTLAGTSLGWIAVSSTWAEACIAFSLVLVALDLPSTPQERPVGSPALLAYGFGLVHGLGFAGALGELGLSQDAIAPALLGFNIGVELGQLAFVALCLGVAMLVRRLRPDAAISTSSIRHGAVTASAYVIGGLGAYFALERTSELLRPWLGT